MDFLKEYTGREEVERFVIGLPRQPDGSDSENLPRVREFAARLEKAFPQIPVSWYDERFTSVLAHRAMIDGGLRKKARQDKALVDKISAVIILEDFLKRKE